MRTGHHYTSNLPFLCAFGVHKWKKIEAQSECRPGFIICAKCGQIRHTTGR